MRNRPRPGSEIAKSISSFGENILEYIKPQTGRIHSDFRQIGAPSKSWSGTSPVVFWPG